MPVPVATTLPVRRRSLLVALALPVLAAVVAASCGGGAGGAGGAGDVTLSAEARRGRDIASAKGCFSCHGLRGIGGVAGGWNGLYNAEVPLSDGSTVRADDFYLRQSIRDPNASRRAGTKDVMPATTLSEGEVAAIVAYIQALRDA